MRTLRQIVWKIFVVGVFLIPYRASCRIKEDGPPEKNAAKPELDFPDLPKIATIRGWASEFSVLAGNLYLKPVESPIGYNFAFSGAQIATTYQFLGGNWYPDFRPKLGAQIIRRARTSSRDANQTLNGWALGGGITTIIEEYRSIAFEIALEGWNRMDVIAAEYDESETLRILYRSAELRGTIGLKLNRPDASYLLDIGYGHADFKPVGKMSGLGRPAELKATNFLISFSYLPR